MRIVYRTILLSFISIILLFFVGNRLFFYSPGILEKAASKITYPFLHAQNVIVNTLQSKKRRSMQIESLILKVDELKRKEEDLLAHIVQYEATQGFIEDSEDIRSFRDRYSYDYCILAQVVMRHLASDAHYYFINIGSDKGIANGMVALYKNCLVGRVVEVYPYYSKVQLITDRSCHVAAYCKKTKSLGIHMGLNNENGMSLRHVSHLKKIRENDYILSSGDGLVFPRGFALGTVENAIIDGAYYNIKVKPLLDFQELKYCYVVQKGAKPNG